MLGRCNAITQNDPDFGMNEEEIARQLVITPGTTANHIEGILRRLGFRSRVQIATWAAEWGLYRRDDGDRSST